MFSIVGHRTIRNRNYFTSSNRLQGDRKTWMWAGSGGILHREIKWDKNETRRTSKEGNKNYECLLWYHHSDKDNFSFQQNWSTGSCQSSLLRYVICESEMSPHII